MSTSPIPSWAREQSPTYRGPTTGGVFRLAVLVLIAVICWQWFAATEGGARQVDRREGVSFCEEHKGQLAWDRICADTRRMHR